jgi:hypothetical protein
MALFSYPFQTILLSSDPNMPWYDRAATELIHFLAEGRVAMAVDDLLEAAATPALTIR